MAQKYLGKRRTTRWEVTRSAPPISCEVQEPRPAPPHTRKDGESEPAQTGQHSQHNEQWHQHDGKTQDAVYTRLSFHTIAACYVTCSRGANSRLHTLPTAGQAGLVHGIACPSPKRPVAS